jgi:hypothetical protein
VPCTQRDRRPGIFGAALGWLAPEFRSVASRTTGQIRPPTGGTASFIWAVGILNEFPAAPAKTRDLARDVLARTVLRWWYTTADTSTTAATLIANDLDTAGFARLLHRIRTAMPPLDQTLASWLTDAKKILTNHPPEPESPALAPCSAPRETHHRPHE